MLTAVYQELRKLADSPLPDNRTAEALGATDLIHEAYQRIAGTADHARWSGAGHFFGAAAEAMRRILIERVRSNATVKWGGDRGRISDDGFDALNPEVPMRLVELDDAVTEFEKHHPRKAEFVKVRFFARLTINQAPAALSISPAAAERNWAYASAWPNTETECCVDCVAYSKPVIRRHILWLR